ncbi:MAG: YcxB family protein [Ferruginibacter sp.]|nr:YcxB family protein [Ferruginibacter sp.]
MKLAYSLTEDDFLQHQLFIASKSERIKKKRLRSWIIVTLAFFCLAFLFFTSGNSILKYYFIAAGVLSLVLYPVYLRSYYKSHYKKFISEHYKDRLNENSIVIFSEENIETFDTTGESKIKLTQIEEIVETGSYIYLKLKVGGSLIIPKLRVQNFDHVRLELQKLSDQLNVPFVTELNWKWK